MTLRSISFPSLSRTDVSGLADHEVSLGHIGDMSTLGVSPLYGMGTVDI